MGGVQARFWYRCGLSLHGATELNVQRLAPTLTLCSDLNGFHEIDDVSSDDVGVTSLLLQAAGRWLSNETTHTCAFLELRQSSVAWSSTDSAFFRAVSRHFLPADAPRLYKELSRGCWPATLAGLLPRHPIYLDLLPDDVRNEMDSRPRAAPQLVQALGANGMVCGQVVNVVDGGSVACGRIVPAASRHFGAGSPSIDAAGDIVRLRF
jgi:arginine N-succinyltransferase